jgi:hypothetical protein
VSGATYSLLRHPEELAVARLGPGADVPAWAAGATLLSVTATAAETSVVCARAAVPRKVRQEGPFTAFEVEGPLDLALVGVLARLLEPLAQQEVPVFTIATFDTDWVLVPAADADRAETAWRRGGHTVRPAPDRPTHGGGDR